MQLTHQDNEENNTNMQVLKKTMQLLWAGYDYRFQLSNQRSTNKHT